MEFHVGVTFRKLSAFPLVSNVGLLLVGAAIKYSIFGGEKFVIKKYRMTVL